jgi:hypothetical protein
MSNWLVTSTGRPPSRGPKERNTAVSMPDAPGPPGLSSNEPILSRCVLDRARIIATS